MYRKIVLQGKGAYTITLPKKWVLENNLEKGGVVKINENESSLIINTEEYTQKKCKKIEIKLTKNSVEGIRSILGSLYRQGFDEILIEIDKKEILIDLEKAINTLFGLELFILSQHKILVKTIYGNEKTEIKMHVIRIIYSIKTIQEYIKMDFINKKFDSFDKIVQIRNNILKQRDIILRIIKKERLFQDNTFPYYTITLSLWGVTRNYYHMYKDISKEDISFDKLFENTSNYFNKTFENINSLNIKKINEKYKEYQKINSILKKKIKKTIIASYCLNVMREIQLSDSNISLLNLDN